MTSGISMNGFAWPVIGARPDSTETSTGVADRFAPRFGRGDHMDWGGGGWIVMVVMMSAFWIGLLGLGAWAIHSFSRRGTHAPSDSAIEIARRRFASGEITQEQFEAIKRGLGQ